MVGVHVHVFLFYTISEGEDADLVSDAAQKLEEYLEADINNEEG